MKGILLTILLGYAAPTVAQTRAEPRLILSPFFGLGAGGDLWEIPRQPLLILGTEAAPVYDTLHLTRRINPGLMIGISGTVFRSERFGISGEMVFQSLSSEDLCVMVRENPDATHKNGQICGNISSHSITPSTVGFSLGGIFRPLPRAAVSPYGRVQAGLAVRSGSVIGMVSSFPEGSLQIERVILNDPSSTRLSPTVGFAGGLMIPLGTGYQFRLEIRDQVLMLQRTTGPATIANDSRPTVENSAFHSVGLAAGLDIVLEQKRGRRY
jgi:hypothetical protein